MIFHSQYITVSFPIVPLGTQTIGTWGDWFRVCDLGHCAGVGGWSFPGEYPDENCSNRIREWFIQKTGVSENSVPLNPMVNDHYPY